MKKMFLVTILLIGTSNLCGQEQEKIDYSQDWLKKSLEGEYLDSTEYLSKIKQYELSKLWENSRFLGFVGANYQRLQIHFMSIIKNENNPNQYFVYGKSKVNDNICEFLGTIDLLYARKHKESVADTVIQGILITGYAFFENPNQSHTGIFKGIAASHWYINQDDKLKYDDLEAEADGYSNNEFLGIWKSYKTHKAITCNWGEYRIPFSGDLDIGTGEFAPNEKYLKYGWENYDKAYVRGNQEALKLEKSDWWK